jgi:hypothetical protein
MTRLSRDVSEFREIQVSDEEEHWKPLRRI